MNPTPDAGSAAHVVLVVDDALDTLRLLSDALAAEGHTVLVARDADEARARLALTVPDAVLLDAVMPGTDGFTLCREIKATPAWQHVPVLFMTGLSDTERLVQGFASGAVDYVVKPLRLPEVMARLATHAGNARAARLAQEAVDVAGLGTVVLDAQGRVAWSSPRARDCLAAGFPADARGAAAWLSAVPAGGESAQALPDGQRLLARHLGPGRPGESMLLLRTAREQPAARGSGPTLTPRETEVLSWLAKGKTNRDIGDILGMSPRTVNKHLEHIYEKLGVETRTAAVAAASRLQAG